MARVDVGRFGVFKIPSVMCGHEGTYVPAGVALALSAVECQPAAASLPDEMAMEDEDFWCHFLV